MLGIHRIGHRFIIIIDRRFVDRHGLSRPGGIDLTSNRDFLFILISDAGGNFAQIVIQLCLPLKGDGINGKTTRAHARRHLEPKSAQIPFAVVKNVRGKLIRFCRSAHINYIRQVEKIGLPATVRLDSKGLAAFLPVFTVAGRNKIQLDLIGSGIVFQTHHQSVAHRQKGTVRRTGTHIDARRLHNGVF